ncbi:MAG: hypothetical protein JJT75_09960 [Opitutales bacterium]|nr:hypothetical protein [Opitutales bacterium]MCH8540686.1 hypothetical protein [Opitutales bacterium]
MGEKDTPILMGLGLDNKDGHKRLTQAESFIIAGGSESTHGRLTETAMKTMEDLGSRAKDLRSVEKKELTDLLRKNLPDP